MFTLGLVWETLSYISLFIEFTSNLWDPLIISCNTSLIIAFFWTVIITFFFKVVDAVLSVKMTNQRGEIKYPIKVCLCSSVKVLNIAYIFVSKHFCLLRCRGSIFWKLMDKVRETAICWRDMHSILAALPKGCHYESRQPRLLASTSIFRRQKCSSVFKLLLTIHENLKKSVKGIFFTVFPQVQLVCSLDPNELCGIEEAWDIWIFWLHACTAYVFHLPYRGFFLKRCFVSQRSWYDKGANRETS